MKNLEFYHVDSRYIDYLSPHAPHLFHNKKPGQHNERKYIGVVLHINDMDYFAPLSSYKSKHDSMKEKLDFIKIKRYAVINLNNMFPVPASEYEYVKIKDQKDIRYRTLLQAEYRYIKGIQEKIRKNALEVYKHKIKNGNTTGLSKRCNDFIDLEKLCQAYNKSN